MPLVSENRLLTLYDIPITLPQALITVGSWIAIATIKLEEGQTVDYRWLQIYISEFTPPAGNTDPCAGTGKVTINDAFPTASIAAVFLIKDWASLSEPWNQPYLDMVPCPSNFEDAADSVAPVIAKRSLNETLTITEAGDYTLVLLNNSTNKDILVSVNGAITVDTDPL